jgi:hypothetical protein
MASIRRCQRLGRSSNLRIRTNYETSKTDSELVWSFQHLPEEQDN